MKTQKFQLFITDAKHCIVTDWVEFNPFDGYSEYANVRKALREQKYVIALPSITGGTLFIPPAVYSNSVVEIKVSDVEEETEN